VSHLPHRQRVGFALLAMLAGACTLSLTVLAPVLAASA